MVCRCRHVVCNSLQEGTFKVFSQRYLPQEIFHTCLLGYRFCNLVVVNSYLYNFSLGQLVSKLLFIYLSKPYSVDALLHTIPYISLLHAPTKS